MTFPFIMFNIFEQLKKEIMMVKTIVKPNSNSVHNQIGLLLGAFDGTHYSFTPFNNGKSFCTKSHERIEKKRTSAFVNADEYQLMNSDIIFIHSLDTNKIALYHQISDVE